MTVLESVVGALAALALMSTAACAAPAHSSPSDNAPVASRIDAPALKASFTPEPEPACEVRAVRTRNGVRFEATAQIDADPDSEYELVITKVDRDGASDIVQRGPLGDGVRLGGAEIGLAAGARYRAVLTIHEADEEICRDEVRS